MSVHNLTMNGRVPVDDDGHTATLRKSPTEAQIWRHLRQVFRDAGHWAERIESGGTSRGIPDVHVVDGGFWIELKRWGRLGTWSTWQRAWALRYVESGGRCFVLSTSGSNVWLWDCQRLYKAGVDLMTVKLNGQAEELLWKDLVKRLWNRDGMRVSGAPAYLKKV